MPPAALTLLHTSDWHLGRAFHGRRPEAMFAAFLDWLLDTLAAQEVDVLLVAGDVFDTQTPTPRVQALYYRFLARLAAQGRCRHVVITAGNHDSPAFLDAPQHVLAALNVHVVGAAKETPEQEVLTLRAPDGTPELIVCAVPYLHERDLRRAQPDESAADKERRLAEGIHAHYAAVAHAAQAQRAALGAAGDELPIVAMGHLFAAGASTVEGDGVRSLYVGSLAQVGADTFADAFDYVALGHLHRAQCVAGKTHIRYSGAPQVMGFGEAGQEKSVCLVRWQGRTPDVQTLPVPCFQPMARLQGDEAALAPELARLAAQDAPVWLEIRYTGTLAPAEMQHWLHEQTAGSALDILRLHHQGLAERALAPEAEGEALESLTPENVFERLLATHAIADDERETLWRSYRELLDELRTAGMDMPCAS
ncbi:MAG: exonuclease SbcCD subunit D C-terminal domain-containing protein [Rhodocyclaceae bacterium]|nr:exonuclease SbcCD subunit D C-terminal domain-containing protein [Rhodocyclaceae bacterium]